MSIFNIEYRAITSSVQLHKGPKRHSKKQGLKYKVLSLTHYDFCGAACNPTDYIYIAVGAIY